MKRTSIFLTSSLFLLSCFGQAPRPPVTNLNGLTDVTLISPANGQALIYNSGTSQWINATIPQGALSTLSDVTIGTPLDNQLLKYSSASSKWLNYGPLNFTDLTGNINVLQMASGSGANANTFWRGDGSWATNTGAAAGTAGNVLTSDGTNWISAPPAALVPATKVIFISTLGTSTYTPTTGARALFVETIGGGGGGGGALASASNSTAGGGGGGGGWAGKYLSAPLKANYTITVGGAGTGGANTGAGGGGTGGTTTFDSPSVCTATGGIGGTGSSTAGTAIVWTASGGTGGLGTVGDKGGAGGDGDYGARLSGTQAKGGSSGGCIISSSSSGGLNGSAGSAGVNGGGGSGASSISATGFAGGNGAQGLIRVTEYF